MCCLFFFSKEHHWVLLLVGALHVPMLLLHPNPSGHLHQIYDGKQEAKLAAVFVAISLGSVVFIFLEFRQMINNGWQDYRR